MLKREELSNPKSCINKAADDEPLFVLRGNDPIAAYCIRTWAEQATLLNAHEPEKITEARNTAAQFDKWRAGRPPKRTVDDSKAVNAPQ